MSLKVGDSMVINRPAVTTFSAKATEVKKVLSGRHSDYRLVPFEIKFRLPKLRKERIISDRDEFGKIVSSKVPTRRLFR